MKIVTVAAGGVAMARGPSIVFTIRGIQRGSAFWHRPADPMVLANKLIDSGKAAVHIGTMRASWGPEVKP